MTLKIRVELLRIAPSVLFRSHRVAPANNDKTRLCGVEATQVELGMPRLGPGLRLVFVQTRYGRPVLLGATETGSGISATNFRDAPGGFAQNLVQVASGSQQCIEQLVRGCGCG